MKPCKARMLCCWKFIEPQQSSSSAHQGTNKILGDQLSSEKLKNLLVFAVVEVNLLQGIPVRVGNFLMSSSDSKPLSISH